MCVQVLYASVKSLVSYCCGSWSRRGCRRFEELRGLLRRLPRLDFGDRLAQLPGFFLDEAVEVVAHGDAELGVDLIVPLLEPWEKLDRQDRRGTRAGVVAAAETFLDFNEMPPQQNLWVDSGSGRRLQIVK